MGYWPLGIMCLLCSGALWIIAAITWSRNAIYFSEGALPIIGIDNVLL